MAQAIGRGLLEYKATRGHSSARYWLGFPTPQPFRIGRINFNNWFVEKSAFLGHACSCVDASFLYGCSAALLDAAWSFALRKGHWICRFCLLFLASGQDSFQICEFLLADFSGSPWIFAKFPASLPLCSSAMDVKVSQFQSIFSVG